MIWARKSIGLSVAEAAKRIGVSIAVLESWETGDRLPTVTQFRKAAAVYKRPTFVLKLRRPPTDFQPMRDFRRADAAPMPYWLNVGIRRALEQLEMFHEMMEFAPPVESDVPPMRIPDGVTSAAATLRDSLGVTVAEQRHWADAEAALAEWKRAAERLGVFVVQFHNVDVATARGFARRNTPFSVIGLNSKDTPKGKIFTLFHELVHLGMDDGGVCDLAVRSQFELERFCSRVAGAALMPKDDVGHQLLGLRDMSDQRLLDRLYEVGTRFHTSSEATLIRAIELGALDESSWERLAPMLRERYEEAKGARKQTGGDFYRTHISRYGRTYVETVVEAYSSDSLTLAEVCDALDLTVGQVPKLIGAL